MPYLKKYSILLRDKNRRVYNKHTRKKIFREKKPWILWWLCPSVKGKAQYYFFFFFLFDRLKEHWLIGLSDATFNEQRGRTVGGKLAWSSFCRTELMKPLWIKAGVCCGSWLMCSSNTSHFTKKMFYENQEWKGSPVSLCNAIKLPLMWLSGTIIIRLFNITS